MAQLALLAVSLLWGSTFFSQQIGVNSIGSGISATALFMGLRFLLATIIMPIVLPRVWKNLDRHTVRDGLFLSIPFFISYASQVTGLQSTTPTMSALLSNMTILFTPLFGVLFFKERIPRSLFIGMAVSLVGVFVMTNPSFGSGFGAGEAASVVCAIAFAVQIQLTNIFTKRSSPIGITFVLFAASTLYSLLLLLVLPSGLTLLSTLPSQLSNKDLLWTVAYNGTICSVVAVGLLNQFQRYVSPTRAALIYMTEPVFAAVFAVIFVHEPMTSAKLVGGSIILFGNLFVEWLKERPR